MTENGEIRVAHQVSLDKQMTVYLSRMDQKLLRETLSNISKLLEKIFDIVDDIVLLDQNPNPDRGVVVKFIDSCREQLKNDYNNINLLNY